MQFYKTKQKVFSKLYSQFFFDIKDIFELSRKNQKTINKQLRISVNLSLFFPFYLNIFPFQYYL